MLLQQRAGQVRRASAGGRGTFWMLRASCVEGRGLCEGITGEVILSRRRGRALASLRRKYALPECYKAKMLWLEQRGVLDIDTRFRPQFEYMAALRKLMIVISDQL
jgi:hypothetical protein